MRPRNPILWMAAFALALAAAPIATADEIGGSGFGVPADEGPSEWLWGIEGLQRTPFDIGASFGVGFWDFKMDNKIRWDDDQFFDPDPGDSDARGEKIEIEDVTGITGGLRFAGLIGYWACCVMVEPAIAIQWNRPLGDGRTDKGPRVRGLDDGENDEFYQAELELASGWDLLFGPQMTWMVSEDTAYVGQFIGGMPVVFFPFVGVSHSDFDVEILHRDNGASFKTDRDFEDRSFVVGFDLDVPLAETGGFSHFLTWGFKWNDGDEKHTNRFGPGALDAPNGNPSNSDFVTNVFSDREGWRMELRYRIVFNDFGSIFTRNIFGPVD